MSRLNTPLPYLYRPPGNKCLLCHKSVNMKRNQEDWSWWMRSCDRRIIGVVHDICLEDLPPTCGAQN